MRKLSLVISIAAALTLAGTAVAAGPVRSEAVFDFPYPEVYTECDDYDVMLSDMHIERRTLTWYEGGTPVLDRRHVEFSGTFTNSETGKTYREQGRGRAAPAGDASQPPSSRPELPINHLAGPGRRTAHEVVAADEPDVPAGGYPGHLLVNRSYVPLNEGNRGSRNRRQRPVRKHPAPRRKQRPL